MRWGSLVMAGVLATVALALLPARARAEYRAYELEVVDILDCQLNKRDKCRSARITTAVSPDLYVQTNGGDGRVSAVVLATWMCYGDTSGYRDICPRPGPRNPKFNPGDDVRVVLKKHITEGWLGKVELVYRDDFLGANVVGVRFPDRKNVYARYYEWDLAKPGSAPATGPAQSGSAPSAPSATGAPQPAAVPGTAPSGAAPPGAAPQNEPPK